MHPGRSERAAQIYSGKTWENAQKSKDGRVKQSPNPSPQSLTKPNASETFVQFLRWAVVQVYN